MSPAVSLPALFNQVTLGQRGGINGSGVTRQGAESLLYLCAVKWWFWRMAKMPRGRGDNACIGPRRPKGLARVRQKRTWSFPNGASSPIDAYFSL